MEPKWRQVGPRSSQNGAKLASKTDLGALLGDLCGSGMPRDALGRDLGPQRTDLGAQNPPKIDPKSTKNRSKIGSFFKYLFILHFEAFLEDFGSMLARISEVFGHPKRLQTASADFLKKCTAPQREHDFRGQKPPEIDEKSMQNRCGS